MRFGRALDLAQPCREEIWVKLAAVGPSGGNVECAVIWVCGVWGLVEREEGVEEGCAGKVGDPVHAVVYGLLTL